MINSTMLNSTFIKLFDMTIFQENDIILEDTSVGDILLSPSEKGFFKGEKLSGELTSVGMGICTTVSEGKNDIESQMLLKTDDGSHILMDYKSYFDLDSKVEEKLSNGEKVDSSEYYYMGTAGFKTDSEKYKWLERKICICKTEIVNWEELKITVLMI